MYFDEAVEEEQVNITIETLKLADSPEFKVIEEEMTAKLQKLNAETAAKLASFGMWIFTYNL